MKSKIIALSMALFVFAGSSMTAQAGLCPNPNSPDGLHHFEYGHQYCEFQDWGYVKDLGSHREIYGYDQDANPIYGPECKMTQKVEYFKYVCFLCGLEDSNGSHEHFGPIQHSISHNK